MSDSAGDVRSVFEFARAGVLLVAAGVLVRIVPMRVIARRVERTLPRTVSGAAADFAARRVRWALDAVQRRLPWSVPCLATAIAANRLLAWHGVPSELWFGVRANGEPTIDAHAWLIAEGRIVTGEATRSEYVPMHALITAASSRT